MLFQLSLFTLCYIYSVTGVSHLNLQCIFILTSKAANQKRFTKNRFIAKFPLLLSVYNILCKNKQ